jgi:hypothetical protein
MVSCIVKTAASIISVGHCENKYEWRLTPGDDEVEEPLSTGGESNVERTEARCWDLTDNNPACWSPSELEEAVDCVRTH